MVDLLISNDYEVRAIDNFAGGHLKNINHLKNEIYFNLIEEDIRKLSENESYLKMSM